MNGDFEKGSQYPFYCSRTTIGGKEAHAIFDLHGDYRTPLEAFPDTDEGMVAAEFRAIELAQARRASVQTKPADWRWPTPGGAGNA